MTCTIREATPGDAATLAGIINLAYRVEDFFKVGDRTDKQEVETLIEKDAFLVAEPSAGEVAGCIYVAVKEGRGYFGMLSVSPTHQGQGLGRELIEAAEHRCRAAGCTEMDLWVVNLREDLPTWYGRLGYSETATAPWPEDYLHQLSRPAHFVVMSKHLAATLPAEDHDG